jgi:hypothetical protein
MLDDAYSNGHEAAFYGSDSVNLIAYAIKKYLTKIIWVDLIILNPIECCFLRGERAGFVKRQRVQPMLHPSAVFNPILDMFDLFKKSAATRIG